jgi:hypothetical protein
MKIRAILTSTAFLTLLLASCSKHQPTPATSPGFVDFGIAQVSDTGTNHFKSDLGDGKVCIVRSFLIGGQTAGQMIVSSAAIEARDPDNPYLLHRVIGFNPKTNSPDQSVEFSNGYYHIRVKPHIRP